MRASRIKLRFYTECHSREEDEEKTENKTSVVNSANNLRSKMVAKSAAELLINISVAILLNQGY